MRSRIVNKSNHPLFGKTHNKFTICLRSKPGVLGDKKKQLNHMFGKITSALAYANARNNEKTNVY